MQALFPAAYNLDDRVAYEEWRDWKLGQGTPTVADLEVRVDSTDPGGGDIDAIRDRCERYNLALYRTQPVGDDARSLVRRLGAALGLHRLDNNLRAGEDSISSIEVREQQGNRYIPYTDKPLSWHTDGYYNRLSEQVYAIIMHCEQPAARGGESYLLDHELVYIRLRDENPDYVRALMHPEVMTIPGNVESGVEIRAAQTGPVFSLHRSSGRLHMRFSARQRNIVWRDDPLVREAVSRIHSILASGEGVVHLVLQAGQGVICNNVLHNRTAFVDSGGFKRRLLRARFFDRIS